MVDEPLYLETKYYTVEIQLMLGDYKEILERKEEFVKEVKEKKDLQTVIFTLGNQESVKEVSDQERELFRKVSGLLMSAITPSTSILFINAKQSQTLDLESIYDQTDDYYIEIIQDTLQT